MLFPKISRRLALQFTGFIFALMLVNGFIFLAADLGNARYQSQGRLERAIEPLMRHPGTAADIAERGLPPQMRGRVRIITADGTVVFSGGLYQDIHFVPVEGITRVWIDEDVYRILTRTIVRDGKTIGYVQLADIERIQSDELVERALVYMLVTILISFGVYQVGLHFARKSLRPAEDAMERLEQFTQDASHELRTPLATLNSSLDVALKSKQYKEGIESAKDDVKRLTLLTERLLELARLDRLLIKKEAVDMARLVQESVAAFQPMIAEKKIEIQETIADVSVEGDETLIRQLVDNLLGNAIKFSPEQSTIHLSLSKNELQIADEGMGIQKDALPHIFNRFYQTDEARSGNGFGLGLALVKRIADLHTWTIEVESEKGKGARFRVKW